jgi:hypothetical protein
MAQGQAGSRVTGLESGDKFFFQTLLLNENAGSQAKRLVPVWVSGDVEWKQSGACNCGANTNTNGALICGIQIGIEGSITVSVQPSCSTTQARPKLGCNHR